MNKVLRLMKGLLLLSFFGVFTGDLASAISMIDQHQQVIDTTVGGLAIGGASEQKLAQVVTSGISGFLTEVSFPVSCSYGDLIVEIQETNEQRTPNGVVLTSQTFPGESLSYSTGFTNLAFSVPASFYTGNHFAIVLSSTGGCGVFRGPKGDSYPGGTAFFDARPNQKGVWLYLGDRSDLPFQTMVAPPSGSISGRAAINIAGYINLGVRNAAVSLQGTSYSATTDSDGNFTLSNIPFGNYNLIISATNLNPLTQAISLSGQNLQVTLPLMTASGAEGPKCDVNGDNRLGLDDAIYVLQILSGIRQ